MPPAALQCCQMLFHKAVHRRMKVPVANRRADDHPIVVMPFDDIGTVQVQGVRIDAQLFKLRGEKRSDFTCLPVAGGKEN